MNTKIKALSAKLTAKKHLHRQYQAVLKATNELTEVLNNEIGEIDSQIKAIQAACPHNDEQVKQYKHSQFYTWSGNGHNCDYYTCRTCGREIKV